MPIYEYRCSECSRTFEKIIWNTKDEKVQCPYCKGEKVIRQLSAFSMSGTQSGKGVTMPSSCGPSSSGFS
jgi:putative FmdB family regulatory protein